MPEMTKIDVDELTRQFFSQLAGSHSVKKTVPSHAQYDWDDWDAISEETLEAMLVSGSYDKSIEKDAQALIAPLHIKLEALSDNERLKLLEGVTRVRREMISYAAHRRKTLFGGYTVSDDVLGQIGVQLASGSTSSQPLPSPSLSDHGRTVGHLVQLYFSEHEGKWKNTVRDEKRLPFKWFIELVGSERNVRDIGYQDILLLRAKFENLRLQAPASATLEDAQAKAPHERVSPKTANKKLATIKTFLRWLRKLGEIEVVPADQIGIDVPPIPVTKARRDFEPSEYDQLFSSALFTGFKNTKRRYLPGDQLNLDDDYWMPLVLAYSGMRISEPLQVAAEDVCIDTEFPHFRLDGSEIKLKSVAATRLVPIHPDLIDFGFLDFVKSKQATAPEMRLMSAIVSKDEVGNYYSKKIGRYLDRVGLDDPRIVAHSFRHTFISAMRNAGVPESDRKFMMGHSDSSVAHNYGSPTKISVLYQWAAKVDLGLSAGTRKRLVQNAMALSK
ncbi:MAG: site-specific integrase [Pseudomonadota bacterium]